VSALLIPANAMLLPGTTAAGFSSQRSMLAAVQTMLEALDASE